MDDPELLRRIADTTTDFKTRLQAELQLQPGRSMTREAALDIVGDRDHRAAAERNLRTMLVQRMITEDIPESHGGAPKVYLASGEWLATPRVRNPRALHPALNLTDPSLAEQLASPHGGGTPLFPPTGVGDAERPANRGPTTVGGDTRNVPERLYVETFKRINVQNVTCCPTTVGGKASPEAVARLQERVRRYVGDGDYGRQWSTPQRAYLWTDAERLESIQQALNVCTAADFVVKKTAGCALWSYSQVYYRQMRELRERG